MLGGIAGRRIGEPDDQGLAVRQVLQDESLAIAVRVIPGAADGGARPVGATGGDLRTRERGVEQAESGEAGEQAAQTDGACGLASQEQAAAVRAAPATPLPILL